MGFFSSIFKAISDIFKSVMQTISKFFSKVFGSPLVAALAVFVVAWMCAGFPAWQVFLESPWLFLTSSPFLAAAAMNVVFEIIAAISPDFRQFLGKLFGFISFLLLAINIGAFLTTGQLFNAAAWTTSILGLASESAAVFAWCFEFISMLTVANFVSGMSAGVDSGYAEAWVDGFMTVPVVIGEVIDSAVNAAFRSTSNLLLLGLAGLGLYWAFGGGERETVIQVEGAT